MTKTKLENCIWEYGRDIYSFCRSLTLNLQEADDLYQDTFLKAMELIHDIDCEKNPKSYLISIALRLWKNKKRKYAWRNRIANVFSMTDELNLDDTEEPAFSPEYELLKKEETDLVRQGGKQAAGKAKNTNPSFLYGRFTDRTDCFCFKNARWNCKKPIISGKKIIRKGIGGCFR